MKRLTKYLTIFAILMLGLFIIGCNTTGKAIDDTDKEFHEEETLNEKEHAEREHTEGEHHGEDEDHGDFSVDIKCEQLKQMKIKDIASLWNINSETLLDEIISEYGLKGIYTTDSLLDDLRSENKFQPRGVKEIAENIKGPLGPEDNKKVKAIEKAISACPLGEVNDPYPGNCPSYYDGNEDDNCDYGEPI